MSRSPGRRRAARDTITFQIDRLPNYMLDDSLGRPSNSHGWAPSCNCGHARGQLGSDEKCKTSYAICSACCPRVSASVCLVASRRSVSRPLATSSRAAFYERAVGLRYHHGKEGGASGCDCCRWALLGNHSASRLCNALAPTRPSFRPLRRSLLDDGLYLQTGIQTRLGQD